MSTNDFEIKSKGEHFRKQNKERLNAMKMFCPLIKDNCKTTQCMSWFVPPLHEVAGRMYHYPSQCVCSLVTGEISMVEG